MRKSRPALFRVRHFQEEIVVLCVRWYLRYPLSYRDLEEMMAERGLTLIIQPLPAGSCTTRPFWRSESGARCGSRIDAGALMRPTSEWQDAGRICIEPWIQPATRSTFYSPRTRSHCGQRFPATCSVWSDFTPHHHCGWSSRLSILPDRLPSHH